MMKNKFQVLEDEIRDDVADSLNRHQDKEFYRKGLRWNHVHYLRRRVGDIIENINDFLVNSPKK